MGSAACRKRTGGMRDNRHSYAYSSTQNNSKIISQTDNLSGEQVVYTYDALNRLASAQATNNSWGQSYSYDGFGNLTDQNVIAGSAPAYHVVPDPATNYVSTTDANGNASGYTYDVENRIAIGQRRCSPRAAINTGIRRGTRRCGKRCAA
jgi:YD repeat-containing protein